MEEIRILKKENFIAMIAGSIGSRAYCNVLGEIGGETKNLTEEGKLSCAYFVSCLLKIFDLIDCLHLTVDGIVDEMEARWKEVDSSDISAGDIIVWEELESHRHIGFYLENGQAVSTSVKKRQVVIHDNILYGQRTIEKVFRVEFY